MQNGCTEISEWNERVGQDVAEKRFDWAPRGGADQMKSEKQLRVFRLRQFATANYLR